MWESDTQRPITITRDYSDSFVTDLAADLSRTHLCCVPTPMPATPDELQMLVDAGLDLSMFDV